MGDMILQTPTQQIKPANQGPIPVLLCNFSVNIPDPIKKHGSIYCLKTDLSISLPSPRLIRETFGSMPIHGMFR